VTGNALVFGSDPDNPSHSKPGDPLVQRAILFGADQTSYAQQVTGLYVVMSKVHFGVQKGATLLPERVELLAGLGDS
jgi:hypothetical protein